MATLRQLAARGRTIICTIHQPRSNIFDLFDKILLLSQGRVIYMGDAKQCVNWFAANSEPVPELSNPTDHFLDVVSYLRYFC